MSWRIQQEAASGMVRMRIHEIAKDRLSGLGQPWGRRDPKVLEEVGRLARHREEGLF